MMSVTIEAATPDQSERFLGVMGSTFGFDPDDEQVERFRKWFEWDRTRVAFDDGVMVGTAGAYSLQMTVPGDVMACGGTTVVAVLPSHRRRGILRQMMAAHLDDVREREEPLAGLWASDSAIYGRFGFGCAAQGCLITVDREHSDFHRLAPSSSPVRMVTSEEAKSLLPPFFDRRRLDTPGFFARDEAWWEKRIFRDPSDQRDGATAYRYAVTETNGGVAGFAQYRFKENWDGGHGHGQLRISQLVASDPTSWAGLWRFVLDHDLTGKIVAYDRPVDDPLLEFLAGRRRAKVEPGDSLWIRVVDVGRALEGRAYLAPVSVVAQVHDPLDGASSVWALDLSPDGSEVTPSHKTPGVTIDAEDLGACFMGWSRFATLGRVGRVEGDPATLQTMDRAFTWSPAPWCPEIF